MRVSLSILLALSVILSIMVPALEAAIPRRRPRRLQRFRPVNARSRFAPRPRRGRQDEDVDYADMNAVDGEEPAGDEAMEELYNGCDWKTNIGGFLNFCKWRKWCADNQGITDFGPYGGVPESCPIEYDEEGADDAAAADDLDAAGAEAEDVEAPPPAEARRRARARFARKGRKVAAKRPVRRGPKKAFKKVRNFRG